MKKRDPIAGICIVAISFAMLIYFGFKYAAFFFVITFVTHLLFGSSYKDKITLISIGGIKTQLKQLKNRTKN